MDEKLTVGQVRRLIEGKPDDAPMFPVFEDARSIGDYEPGVEFLDLEWGKEKGTGREGLIVKVDLVYVDEFESEEDADDA